MIEQLKSNEDDSAAQAIWERYFEKLLPIARSKLASVNDPSIDEEDLLVSVFDRLFRAIREKRFAKLEDRHDLWQILLMLTERKAIDKIRSARSARRSAHLTIRESEIADLANLKELIEREPAPEFVAQFNDSLEWALRQIRDETAREVAILKLEGNTISEMASKLGVCLSTVDRKLRIVKEVWSRIC